MHLPVVGRSILPIIFNSVVFPEPEGPITPRNSPFFTEKLILFRARNCLADRFVPYTLLIFSTRRISICTTSSSLDEFIIAEANRRQNRFSLHSTAATLHFC